MRPPSTPLPARRLPRTAMDALRLRGVAGACYRLGLWWCRATGAWTYPASRCGDLEEMGALDKLYWMHKASRPLARAERGSGLEASFAAAQAVAAELPSGFETEQTLTLSAVGDLLDHPYLEHSAERLYAGVNDLVFGADVAMANLEGVLSAGAGRPLEYSPQSGPALALTPPAFEALLGRGTRGFDFLGLANNHSLDLGAQGAADTRAALAARGIACHGQNEDEAESQRACLLERGGLRLGVIAFTFGLNGHRPPEDRPFLINRARLNDGASADLSALEAQVAHCRRHQADFVIAQLHWGLEHELYPTPAQVALAHRLAELGVDAIIGHHPHVVQPLELYRTTRDPHRLVPIFYSLGNLTTPFSARFLTQSAVARLELARGLRTDGVTRTYVAGASQRLVVQMADDAAQELRLTLVEEADGAPSR